MRPEPLQRIAGDALRELVGRLEPGGSLERIRRLGEDVAADDTEKGVGYGEPVELDVRTAAGGLRRVVLHTAAPNDYGHDRRADRAAEMLLAWDTFPRVPCHGRALDVGIIARGGAELRSLADGDELYLVTDFVPGSVYAGDLRRVAHGREHRARDLDRATALARYLVGLHRGELPAGVNRPAVYRRAVRDLIGDGEGIFGIVDGYPDATPGAPPGRLRAIEEKAHAWRWRLRGEEARLAPTHGDFHPFNILFDDDDRLGVLDTSRGSAGDPADDVVCLALNYVFFAVGDREAWRDGTGPLWRRFWEVYLTATGDHALLEVAPPYLAWRALVVSSPAWYPHMEASHRDRLLGFAEAALDAGRLDPASAEEVFA